MGRNGKFNPNYMDEDEMYDDEFANSRSYRHTRRNKLTYCGYCPAHGGENAGRKERSNRYKDYRKGKSRRRKNRRNKW